MQYFLYFIFFSYEAATGIFDGENNASHIMLLSAQHKINLALVYFLKWELGMSIKGKN